MSLYPALHLCIALHGTAGIAYHIHIYTTPHKRNVHGCFGMDNDDCSMHLPHCGISQGLRGFLVVQIHHQGHVHQYGIYDNIILYLYRNILYGLRHCCLMTYSTTYIKHKNNQHRQRFVDADCSFIHYQRNLIHIIVISSLCVAPSA